jgi:RHS repeat-associated protein
VSCTGWFAEGATVTLTATPAAGHAFTGWSGACSGTGSCALFIDGEKAATATFTGPPTTTYYHTDVLGSVRATTDAAGAPITRHDYFAFGEGSPLAGDPRRFTGKERDFETAFDYFDARYYRNVWGRFTTADDSIFMDILNPQSFNRYAYVYNNPLRWVDPSGHQNQPPDIKRSETITVIGKPPSECLWGCGVDPFAFSFEGLYFFLQGPRQDAIGVRLPSRALFDDEHWISDETLQTLANLSAGLGTGITFGLTDLARQAWSPETDAVIQRSTFEYWLGAAGGLAVRAGVTGFAAGGASPVNLGWWNQNNWARVGWGAVRTPAGKVPTYRFVVGSPNGNIWAHLDLYPKPLGQAIRDFVAQLAGALR